MYSVFIAVCLLATPHKACTETTAVAWIAAPDHPSTVAGCMRHGMLYAASSGVVTTGSYPKIFCRSGSTAGETHAFLTP